MSVDISMTSSTRPWASRMGAVPTSTLYCSPLLEVTTVSFWCDWPSAKVAATGQPPQGSSRWGVDPVAEFALGLIAEMVLEELIGRR